VPSQSAARRGARVVRRAGGCGKLKAVDPMSRRRSASRRVYLEAPLRRPGLLAAPVVTLLVAAAAIALWLPASYRAEALIHVRWGESGAEPSREAPRDLVERRTALRQALLSDDRLARTIAETNPHPGSDVPAAAQVDRLRQELLVRPLSAGAFALEYRHHDPAKAAQVLNVLTTPPAGDGTLAARPGSAISGWEVVAPAAAPSASERPGVVGFAAVGAALGLLLGFVATVVAEWRDPTVKGPEDLEAILPVPLLATLPEWRGRDREE
jgi:uncharacterized protein involved in exopolysaccharide biosynthesis